MANVFELLELFELLLMLKDLLPFFLNFQLQPLILGEARHVASFIVLNLWESIEELVLIVQHYLKRIR